MTPNAGLLLETGARVSRVSEDGDVDLFCYELHRSFSFRTVTCAAAKLWASRLGDFVTIRVIAERHEGPSIDPTVAP